MLSRIKIKNFQSLQDVTLNLGQITIIEGKTDVGKSAVSRALNAFFSNSFSEDYAFKDTFPFGILIEKDGVSAVGRRTTKGVEYKFNDTLYNKTAKAVPAEIKDFLGIKEYAIDEDLSLIFQFQNQFDSPFLLSKEYSSSVSKIISKVSNLNIVMAVIRKLFGEQMSKKQEITLTTNTLKDIKLKKLLYSNIDYLQTLLEELTQKDALLSVKESQLSSLNALCLKSANFNTKTKVTKAKEDSFGAVHSALTLLITKQELLDSHKALLQKAQLFTAKLSSVERKLQIIPESDFSELDAKVEKLAGYKSLASKITSFASKASGLLEKETTLNITLSSVSAELDTLLNSMNLCPFSKGEFFEVCKAKIKSND